MFSSVILSLALCGQASPNIVASPERQKALMAEIHAKQAPKSRPPAARPPAVRPARRRTKTTPYRADDQSAEAQAARTAELERRQRADSPPLSGSELRGAERRERRSVLEQFRKLENATRHSF